MKQFLAKLKAHLIEDWRLGWQFWSVRLGVIGTVVTGVFVAWPDFVLYLWGAMPYEVKALIHPKAVQLLGVFIFGMSVVARFVKQRKLDAKRSKE